MNPAQKLRYTEERKQSLTRIGLSITTFTLLVAFNVTRESGLSRSLLTGLAVILTHTVFSFCWHRFVHKKPLAWPPRIYVAMAMDIGATTLAFYFAARFGSFFYPVFLWVIVGYGLRYGKRALLVAALSGFAEFGLVLKYNPYWQENTLTGVGLWWGILILPAFFLTVQKRMSALNEKLQIELVKSQAAEKAKGEFLANMSHEIRTPLNGVLGMAQILEDADIGDENRRHLNILCNSAGSLLGIVNDILDFSKITSGKMTIETGPLDLHSILEDVVQMLRPTAVSKGLTIELVYPATTLREFMGDPVRIRQIILNLASNAVKFTEVGGVALKVAVTGGSAGRENITLRIEDTGIGIPEDRLLFIFDQFEQADASTSRKFGGTGLGLTISRHLTRKMDGDLQVQSTVGKGSVFIVNLSLPVSSTSTGTVTKRTTWPRFALDVLVAEDNNVNQLVISRLLKKVGIDAVFAVNGQEAIAELERRHFDLVFMDVRMPVMDGLEATRLIRGRSEAWSDIPIIALTADADSDSAHRCLDAGMNLHLGKPVILDQAVAAIEKVCVPTVV